MSVRTPPLPLATTLGRAMTAACAIEFDWTVRQRCVWEDLLLLRLLDLDLLLDFGSRTAAFLSPEGLRRRRTSRKPQKTYCTSTR